MYTHEKQTSLWVKYFRLKNTQKRLAARAIDEVKETAYHLFDLAFASTAKMFIAPRQDSLHHNNESRFNTREI